MSLARALALALTLATVYAAEPVHREVAITIDDLPLGGGDPGPCTLDNVRQITASLLRPFADQKIPLIGFVNAGRCSDLTPAGLHQILNMWLDAGADLGNHTYTHPDLNSTPLDQFEADVLRGEPAVREALAQRARPSGTFAIRSYAPAPIRHQTSARRFPGRARLYRRPGYGRQFRLHVRRGLRRRPHASRSRSG